MEVKHADLSALRIDRSAGASPPPRSKTVVYASVAGGVLLLGGAVWYFLSSLLSPTIEVKLVSASLISPSQSSAVLTASGYVVAQRKAAVASKGTGRLAFLGVVEGDRVLKDQVIARLEDSDIRAQLAQARANLKLNRAELQDAEQSLSRQRELLAKGLSSQAEFDAADARHRRVLAGIEVAQAAVVGAEVAVENMLIRAPFDGTVLTKNADVGEIVAPLAASASSRAAVVTIADMGSLEVEADVSESNIERISPDQPCEITLDAYPDKRYQAFVSKIVPTADRAKATVLVKVGFHSYDSRVLPEMSAKVLFLNKASEAEALTQKPALAIPASSVVQRDGAAIVFTVRDNQAVEIPIQTGRALGSYIEVTSGLVAGDKVVDRPSEEVRDGKKVKVL